MSYRALKHLLGETSLERKCRFLLGAGILVLISGSFWWYALQTEALAYDQTLTTGRLLVNPIVDKYHLKDDKNIRDALEKFQLENETHWPEWLSKYEQRILLPRTREARNEPQDRFERQLLVDFAENDQIFENSRQLPSDHVVVYYGAVRAMPSCLGCHNDLNRERAKKQSIEIPELRENGLIAVVKVKMRTEAIENSIHLNRAILISTALVTALLIMAGSYLIIRYVIVKPVKHLKEVSDAISAGELNVRSEIQTGDEFEDLSHAFNRMLRNLVNMQDRLRKVNTDLDRKVDELARVNLALYESNRIKTDFLATMSHELRTPLTSILGFSEVLLSGPPLTEKQQRWVTNIQTGGQRLLALINDILDLAKIEAGKMEVHIEEFGVGEVADVLLNMFRPMAQKKNIDVRTQIDPGLPFLRQDPVKFQQILSNLLSNAIKFTPEGGRVVLKATTDGEAVVVTVIDTGVGIAPEDQELVFERFRQAANPLTREHAGTGLGLSIVRELSKLLGGEVTLQSELGRGSTFTVRLPIRLSSEPRLEFDLGRDRVDLATAHRAAARLYEAAREGEPDSPAAQVGPPLSVAPEG